MDALTADGIVEKVVRLTPRDATRDDLALVHSSRYLTLAEEEIHHGADQLSTGDTQVNEHRGPRPLRAAGSAVRPLMPFVRERPCGPLPSSDHRDIMLARTMGWVSAW
jgi:acetoin utilization deacetylase AcuC-like enzyme